MGVLFSRIGSDPYYASYERSFGHISKDLSRLEVCDLLLPGKLPSDRLPI